jgi:hypothetical protein
VDQADNGHKLGINPGSNVDQVGLCTMEMGLVHPCFCYILPDKFSILNKLLINFFTFLISIYMSLSSEEDQPHIIMYYFLAFLFTYFCSVRNRCS